MIWKFDRFSLQFLKQDAVIILCISFFLRIIPLFFIFDLQLAGDEIHYWDGASIISRNGFDWNMMKGKGIFMHPPLGMVVLTLPTFFFPHPFSSRLFYSLLGSFAPLLVFMIGKEAFGRRTAFLAGLLMAAYPNHIGFSHYLWPAILFQLLILTAIWFFAIYLRIENKFEYLYFAAVLLGLSLLVKEFAMVVIVSFFGAFLRFKLMVGAKRLILISVLLFGPVIFYSSLATYRLNQPLILSKAYLNTLVQLNKVPRTKKYNQLSFKEKNKMLISKTLNRDWSEIGKNFKIQFYRVWSPHSYIARRALDKGLTWNYMIPYSSVFAWLAVGFYGFIMTMGLFGICMDDQKKHPLKTIFKLCPVVLSLFAFFVGFLSSRYRLPFMFIPILYASHALINFKPMVQSLQKGRMVVFLIVWGLFGHIFISKIGTLNGPG